MMTRFFGTLAVCLGLLVALPGPARADQHAFGFSQGMMQDLGTLPQELHSYALRVNNKGEILGFSGSSNFLYAQGVIQKMPVNSLLGLNDVGQFIGNEGNSAFIYAQGGKTYLEPLMGALSSYANDLNNLGQIVGYSSSSSWTHAFLYSGGIMQDLGTLPGADYSVAYRINNLGQIIGFSGKSWVTDPSEGWSHAFLYSQGVMYDLNELLGVSDLSAHDINDQGQIVGRADGNGFLYSQGVLQDLGNLLGDETGGATAWAINNQGQIVGDSPAYGEFGMGNHAFLYRDGVMEDLGVLPGGVDSCAVDINDGGEVIGWSDIIPPPSGNPTPLPPTALFLGSGLLGLAGLSRRRRRQTT